MKFSEIIEKLGADAQHNSLESFKDLDPTITGVASVHEASEGMFSYIEGGKFTRYLETTAASALILRADEALQNQANLRGIAWIATSDPRLLFAKVIKLFYQPFQPYPGIDPSAIIDSNVEMGQNVYVGAHSVIQRGVKIGDGVQIHPNVVIYPGVIIGDRTILHGNCTIHERSQIGSDCVIHSSAVIGSEGFGFAPTDQGWFKIEQSGSTVLEDGVEVGCNSTVDRPAVGETRIGKNTKLDNLVQIGHGCQIGQNCAFAAQTGLAGGVKVGNNVILAGQVGIANDVVIGDGAIATAQTGISNNVSAGAIVSGTPAIPHKLWLKISVISQRLPELYKILKKKGFFL